MFKYKSSNSILFKAIVWVLVYLFCINTLSFASSDTLAPHVGNPQVYQAMRSMMEEHLAEHQEPIDEFIKQYANKAKSLSAIPYLEEEFMRCINDYSANNMLARLKATLTSSGGKIQIIFVKNEDELPVFEAKKVWGHAGRYVTVFVLEGEGDTEEGRRKIIARLFHEIRARSTKAKELFNERFKNQNPTTPEEISAFIGSMRKSFEKGNLQIQQEIEEAGRIADRSLAREFANLTFAIHPHVMNRDYMMANEPDKEEGPSLSPSTAAMIDEIVHLLKERGFSQMTEILEKDPLSCITAEAVNTPSREKTKELILTKLYTITYPNRYYGNDEGRQFARLISVREFSKMTWDFTFGPCIIDNKWLVFRYRPEYEEKEAIVLRYGQISNRYARNEEVTVEIAGVYYCAIPITPDIKEVSYNFDFRHSYDKAFNDTTNPCYRKDDGNNYLNSCLTLGVRDNESVILEMCADETDPAKSVKESILRNFKLLGVRDPRIFKRPLGGVLYAYRDYDSLPDLVKKLSPAGAKALLDKLKTCHTTGLYIEPHIEKVKDVEDFLFGDKSKLYERVFNGTLEIKSLKAMREAIKLGMSSSIDLLSSHETNIGTMDLIIEGLDGPFPDECRQILTGRKFNEDWSVRFQQAGRDHPQHRGLFLHYAFPRLEKQLENFPGLFTVVAEAAFPEQGNFGFDMYLATQLEKYITSQKRSVMQILDSIGDINIQQKAIKLLIQAGRKDISTEALYGDSRMIPDIVGSRGYLSILEWFVGLDKDDSRLVRNGKFPNILEISSWDYAKAIERQRRAKEVDDGYFIQVLRSFGNRRGVYDFFKECKDEEFKDKTLDSIFKLVDSGMYRTFVPFMARYSKHSAGHWDLERFKKILDWFMGLDRNEQENATSQKGFLGFCIRHKDVLGDVESGFISPGFFVIQIIKEALEGRPPAPSEIADMGEGLSKRVEKVVDKITKLPKTDTTRTGLKALVNILGEDDKKDEEDKDEGAKKIRILPHHFPESQPNVSNSNVVAQGNSGERVVCKAEETARGLSAEEILNPIEAYLDLAQWLTTAGSAKRHGSVFEGVSPQHLAALTNSMFIRKIQYEAEKDVGIMQTTFTQIAGAIRCLAEPTPQNKRYAIPQDLRDILSTDPKVLGQKMAEAADSKNACTYENLTALLAAHNLKAASPFELSGRIIRTRLSDGRLLIIKAVDGQTSDSRREDINSLAGSLLREAAILSHKKELGLDGRYPQILKHRLPDNTKTAESDWFILQNMESVSVCPGTKRLLRAGRDESCYAIAYVCSPESQSYLDDPAQEPNPEQYLIHGIRDRCRLLRQGIVLRKWDGFIHNVQDGRPFEWWFYRTDGEAGALPSWMERCEFSNWRRLCLMDLEHAGIFTEAERGDLDGVSIELGNVVFSAILTCGANFWKQDDYPFKFFGTKHIRFRRFIRDAFIAAYEEYCQVPADVLDKMIDWDELAFRTTYEMGSLIRQEMFQDTAESRQRLEKFLKKYDFKKEDFDRYKDHYATYDLGYGHGVFPIPELIRALWIFTSTAVVERSYQERPTIAKAPPAGSLYSVFKYACDHDITSKEKAISGEALAKYVGQEHETRQEALAFDSIEDDLRGLLLHLHFMKKVPGSGTGKDARYYVPEAFKKKSAELLPILEQFINEDLRPNVALLDQIYEERIKPILETIDVKYARKALNALPQEWRENDLKAAEFISELSRLLQMEDILKQDNSTFIFSEKVTFDNGLGVLLPKLVKSGTRIAVIATNDRQRALIDELNQDKPENERIIYADTIADIRTKIHTARYYYFKVTGDPDTDLQGVITFDITEIVKKIIDALGKVCGIVERERLELLHEAARKFAEAA